jgi:hypothetical protein
MRRTGTVPAPPDAQAGSTVMVRADAMLIARWHEVRLRAGRPMTMQAKVGDELTVRGRISSPTSGTVVRHHLGGKPSR